MKVKNEAPADLFRIDDVWESPRGIRYRVDTILPGRPYKAKLTPLPKQSTTMEVTRVINDMGSGPMSWKRISTKTPAKVPAEAAA